MLNLKYTRIFHTEHYEVSTGIVIADEGMALVFAKEHGATKVQPSQGVAGEVFAGMSLARAVPPTFIPNVEDFVIGVSLSKTLVRTPLAGQSLIRVNGAVKTLVTTAPTSNAQVQLVGNTLNFYTGEAGYAASIQYMYEPTIVEAQALLGQAIIGGLAFQSMGTVGTILRATVATNYFDMSQDWSTALDGVRLGVNGILTLSGSGTLLPNVTVMSCPSVDNPYLSVRLY